MSAYARYSQEIPDLATWRFFRYLLVCKYFCFVCASSYFIVILYCIRVFTDESNNKLKLKLKLSQFLYMKLRSLYSLNHDWQCSQRILPQIIVNTCEGEEIVHIKTDCSDKMVVASQLKKKNYLLVSLFSDLVLHFPTSIYICGVKFLIWLRYWSCFRHSDKSGYCSLYIQFYKLLWLWFYVDLFLNLGFYHNAVE